MIAPFRFLSGAPRIFTLARIWFALGYPRLFLQFRRRTGNYPDIALPRSVDEKFLWRKVFDRNPLFVLVTDKLKAKEYARSKCPELKFAKVLWSGIDPGEIPDAVLRGNVAVKANHGSRWNIMVEGGRLDRPAMERAARGWMSNRYGADKGEWAYQHVDRCILIEQMLMDEGAPARSEYKFHIGSGRTSYVYFVAGRGTPEEREIVFSREGEAYASDNEAGMPLTDFMAPANFQAMRATAERLAEDFDFVRCDLYGIGEEIYFSELTVYPTGGYGTVKNRRLTEQRNRDWDLLRSWFLGNRQRGWRRWYAKALRRRLEQERSGGDAR